MANPFATIILAGGKGTRMGSSERHKVCFEVLGVPVIIRALETYNLCGAALNVVVVGMMAESVMGTVNHRFPGTAFAFQEKQLGTGDAARKGAEILERLRFGGGVLVVAGDKVIDPRVVRELIATHERTRADVTLATARRPAGSSAGILLQNAKGNIVGILEEAERLRLVALGKIYHAFAKHAALNRDTIETLALQHCNEKTARGLLAEIAKVNTASVVLKADFEKAFSGDERAGALRVGDELVPASEMLTRFPQMNLSTYLFRAPVLYDALGRLKSARPNQEEYLTDVFAILSKAKTPAKVVGCEIRNPHDLMAFNNPQELLAIEEVYRKREGRAPESAPRDTESLLRPEAWKQMISSQSNSVRKQFAGWYGSEVPWNHYKAALDSFAARFGADRDVAIIRSPGRINLMGRHIDHQGGTVNVMAVNREIVLVAAPRNDDVVCLANTNDAQFSEQTFRISDLVANLNWDDWQRVIDGPRLQRMLDAARGDWGNYAKASILRLQELFRDRRLRGLDMMVSGDIPMGAGLSSSSALVVAAAEAVRAFNDLPVSARRLVSLCGEGEWFVGTRGGAADHAAIKLSRRGCVTRVGFFPFHIEDSERFFPEHNLIACNSGVYAGKSNLARNIFNAKVTAYHVGRVWFKMLRPDLAPKIEHLRDIDPKRLGLPHQAFAKLITELPARLSRSKVQAAFTQMPEGDRDRLERLFMSHDAPPDGYPVRDVVLFGLSEMARARHCLDLLKKNNASGLGRLMTVSHDGDRVSREKKGKWQRVRTSVSEADLKAWAGGKGAAEDIAKLSGAYACSLPELDRIVDIACKQPGVEGAQLAGAGLGGCIMVLVQEAHTPDVLKTLRANGVSAEVFRPIAGACSVQAV